MIRRYGSVLFLAMCMVCGMAGMRSTAVSSEIPSADFLAAALEYQETAAGSSLELRYTEGSPTPVAPGCGRRNIRYVRTKDVVFVEETLESLKSNQEWVVTETAVHRFSRPDKEYRSLVTKVKGADSTGYLDHISLGGRINDATILDPALRSIAAKSLSTRIRSGIVQTTQETVEGHGCWRVDFAVPQVISPTVSGSVWLDPTIGFCPRRIELRESEAGNTRAIITRYANYLNPCTDVWIPGEASTTLEPSDTSGTVTKTMEVHVGREVPLDELMLEFPSGQRVLVDKQHWIIIP